MPPAVRPWPTGLPRRRKPASPSNPSRSIRATIPQIERSERLPEVDPSLVDALKLLLKLKADEADVAPRLIANASDMERIAAYGDPDVAAMQGWRRDVFGAAALEMKAGRLALKIENGKLKAEPVAR